MRGRAASTIAIAAACALTLLGAGCTVIGSAESADSSQAATVSPIPANVGSYEPGELIVGLTSEAADNATSEGTRRAIEATGATAVETLVHATESMGPMLLVHTDADHRTGDDLAAAAQSIANVSGVSYVQPNYHYSTATNASEVAADPDAAKQYYLNDWESSHGANVAAAWGEVGTTDKVDVAVLDTGVYVMQEYDSSGNLRTESSEADGFDISDNYHQEFDASNLDLADGVDFVHSEEGECKSLVNSENPYGDDNGHGTHIAGVIAANASVGSDSSALPVGMAGVSQNARIIPIKVLDAGGEGDTADFVRAYGYLIDKKQSNELENLHVINLSLALMVSEGGDETEQINDDLTKDEPEDERGKYKKNEGEAGEETAVGLWYEPAEPNDSDDENDWVNTSGDEDIDFSNVKLIAKNDEFLDENEADAEGSDDPDPADDESFQAMIQKAQKCGIATVCAIGNQSESATAEYTSYPSAYDECISVAALDENGKVAGYSVVNDDVDICAPGSNIYSSWGSQADAYATFDGTSQATAIVSGTLSMMWAKNPELTVEKAKAALSSQAHEVTVERQVKTGGSGDSSASNYSAASNETLSAGAVSLSSETGEGLEMRSYTFDALDAAQALSAVPATAAKVALSDENVALSKTSCTYTGSAQKPTVTVKVGSKTLTPNTDYTVQYANNKDAGTAEVTVEGKGGYKGSVVKTFKINQAPLPKGAAKLKTTSYVYTGAVKKPTAVVKVNSKKLTLNTDYTVTYKNNKNPGTATATVTGKGNYEGTLKCTYKIALGTTKVSKLAKGKNCFTAQWARQKNGTVGYQLRYSLKKTMKSAAMKKVAKNATTKLTVKKLKKGKTYYVQVRTYKVIGKKTYYSSWSAAKSVKVK